MALAACADDRYAVGDDGRRGDAGSGGAIAFDNAVLPITRGVAQSTPCWQSTNTKSGTTTNTTNSANTTNAQSGTTTNTANSANAQASTRSTQTGAIAAATLGNTFYVYGIKNESVTGAGQLTADNVVFQNYKVTYGDGTAGTSADNTAGWGYVGNALTDDETANITDNAGTGEQLMKYWDYNANDYTFYAIAAGNSDITSGNMKVSKITNSVSDPYLNGYIIDVAAAADPTKLYIADRMHIDQSANTDPTKTNEYGGQVSFTFRNAMAKVRVAMYETIPGYSLTIDAFRVADAVAPAFGQMTTEETGKFAANVTYDMPGKAGLMYVVYRDATTGSENVPMVMFGGTGDKILTLGDNLKDGVTLGTTAATAVYDRQGGAYTTVYPMEANSDKLKLKVDFTLKSAVGETIEVKGATAEVPAEYLCWRPGYAYTYLFKITDQTNGTIGSLTGLYPITFEALAITDGTGDEEVISTTGEGSNIVTMGYDPATMLMTVGQDDYAEGNTVYASTIEGDKLATPTSANTKLYIATTSDADNNPITESAVSAYLTAFADDPTLVDQPVTVYEQTVAADDYVSTVPKGDGTTDARAIPAMKWTAEGGHVYAVEHEYTTTSADGTSTATAKTYKIVKIDGYDGVTTGTLALSPATMTNAGGTITPKLTVDGQEVSNEDVHYALDFTGEYGSAVPGNVAITGDDTINAAITVPSNTTAGTNYTVTATYNRRTYRATFSVSQ